MTDFFVDFSAAENGDGTDGNQAASDGAEGAWNVVTSTELAEVFAGDRLWLRRTGSGDKKALGLKDGEENDRIEFNGWPVDADDEHWEDRPAHTAQATWDMDAEPHVVVNAHGAAAAKQHRVMRRIHWEEVSTGANEPYVHTAGTHGENRFYKCRASRNTTAPEIGSSSSASFGRMEFDDCTVEGTVPPASQLRTLGAAGSSIVMRVRLIYTSDSGTAFIRTTGGTGSNSPSDVFIEILELTDAGDRYFDFSSNTPNHRTGQGSFVFTTDDDAVGMVSFGGSINPSGVSGFRAILRNMDFEGPNSPAPAATTVSFSSGDYAIYFENVRFPDGASTQITMAGVNAPTRIRGRNITFDPTKLLPKGTGSDAFGPYGATLFFAQVNGTNRWFRLFSNGVAELSNIRRQGGAAVGVKVEMLEYHSSVEGLGRRGQGLYVSEDAGIEASLIPVRGLEYPANLTLVVYFAVVNWGGRENKDNIWIEASAYKADSGFERRLYDSRKLPGKVLVPDDSVWVDGLTNNELVGYTAYRFELPVELPRDDLVRLVYHIADTFDVDEMGNRNTVFFDPQVEVVEV